MHLHHIVPLPGRPIDPLDILHEGEQIQCIDADGAEPWLTEGKVYRFLRWANGNGRLQVQEHPGVNFWAHRFSPSVTR